MIDSSKYRYERKFVISGMLKSEVESIIKLHPAFFSEIYSERWVRNIYFDTFDLINYLENINGDSERVKVRIRWYGDCIEKITNPKLELKIKRGFLGRKKQYSLLPFKLDPNLNHIDLISLIEKSCLSEKIDCIGFQSLFPVILNGYKRKYFLSADKKYRITIDTDQVFYNIGKRNKLFINKQKNESNVILELKYNYDADKNADQITNLFPFRLSKNSKYIEGVNICHY